MEGLVVPLAEESAAQHTGTAQGSTAGETGGQERRSWLATETLVVVVVVVVGLLLPMTWKLQVLPTRWKLQLVRRSSSSSAGGAQPQPPFEMT